MTRRERAVQTVSDLLTARGGKPSPGGAHDWQVDLQAGEHAFPVLVRLPERFPFVRPVIFAGPTVALAEKQYLQIPHTNFDGTLCVVPNETTVDPDAAAAVMAETLASAAELLGAWKDGKINSDFHDEAGAFWPDRKLLRIVNIDLPAGLPASDTYWFQHGNNFYVSADEAPLRDVGNMFLSEKALKIDRGVFLPLSGLVLPTDYPSDITTLRNLIVGRNGDYKRLADRMGQPGNFPLVLRFEARVGAESTEPIYVSMMLWPQPAERPPARHYTVKSPLSGFRPGRAPAQMQQALLLNRGLARVSTQRFDREWIHFRGGAGRSHELFQKHVTIIGCGSLGSEIAMQLIREGIKRIRLVDGEFLSWDNIGRHQLPAMMVGAGKATALAAMIKRTVPGVEVEGIGSSWEDALANDSGLFRPTNLVINATGDWGSSVALNLELFGRVPVMYTWTEPLGAAGHALLVTGLGGCLGCGFDRTGVFSRRVFDWPKSTLLKIPGCGGAFQPYGLAETAVISSMASRTTLDFLANVTQRSELRTWINGPAAGPAAILQPAWKDRVAALPSQIGEIRIPWVHEEACGICS